MPHVPDPRPLLDQSFRQASALVAGVDASMLGRPTPCCDFDVEHLVGHLVFAAHRVAAIGRGQTLADREAVVTEVPDGDWSGAFDAEMDDALAAWKDDALLDSAVALPWATLPGALVAQIYALELVTHGWDLAVATGQTADLDPALAEAVLPVAHQALPPEPRGGELPFGPVVAVDDGAPAYDRLAGYTGRHPHGV